MKLSEGVEWAVHCLVLLAAVPPDRALPASRLAEFHGVAGPYLAKHLQALSRHGLVESVQGPRGGYRLARPAAEITLLDATLAIDGAAPMFVCTEIRRRGPAALAADGYPVACGIHRAMARAEDAFRSSLRETTIADLAIGVLQEAAPEGLRRGAAWLSQVLR